MTKLAKTNVESCPSFCPRFWALCVWPLLSPRRSKLRLRRPRLRRPNRNPQHRRRVHRLLLPNRSRKILRSRPTTFKVGVNVVQLFFNVKDKHGALIPNLTKDDFEIYEDGKQAESQVLRGRTNLPLTLGILIDSSGSQRACSTWRRKSAEPS